MSIHPFTYRLQNLYADQISDLAGYAGASVGYRARVATVGRDYVAVQPGTTSWTAGSPISVGTGPNVVAITPDGLNALVTNPNNITPLTYSGGIWVAGSNISVGTDPNWVVITPDGLRALVTNHGSNNITPLTYSGGVWVAGSPITVGTSPNWIVITPDGLRALVTNYISNDVTPLTFPDPVVYLPGTGVDWQYIQGTSDAKFLSQATWWIQDGANAENSGIDSSHPIPPDELQRRFGNLPLLSATTVNYSTNIDHFILEWTRGNETACLSLISTTTVLLTTTLSTWTSVNVTNKEITLITAAGISDWTPYVGKRLNFGAGGWSRICAANPNGAGLNVARITLPILHDGNIVHQIAHPIPTVSQAFNIESIPEISRLSLNFKGDIGFYGTQVDPDKFRPTLYARTIRTSYSTVINVGVSSFTANSYIIDCDFNDIFDNFNQAINGGSLTVNNTSTLPPAQLLYVVVFWKAGNGNEGSYAGVRIAVGGNTWSNVVFQNCGLFIAAPLQIINLAVFDAPATVGFGSGVYILDWSQLDVIGYFTGTNNSTLGLIVNPSGKLTHPSGTTVNITGTSGDWQIPSGPAAGNFSWATTPNRDFSNGSGTTTLVAGSIAVSIPNLPTDAIVDVWYTTNNDPRGDITPTSQTTSGFTITSTHPLDGNGVAWSWFSPGAGDGGIFLR